MIIVDEVEYYLATNTEVNIYNNLHFGDIVFMNSRKRNLKHLLKVKRHSIHMYFDDVYIFVTSTHERIEVPDFLGFRKYTLLT